MKAKRFFSMIITLSLIVGMFTCIPVHAAGASEDVFNFNFEDGAKLPSFTYGGNSYTVNQGDGWTSYTSVVDGYNGRIADKCLYVNTSNQSGNKYQDFVVPNISSLKDIGGGTIVVSWNLAIEALENTNELYNYVYLVKKSSSGTYSVNTVSFYFNKTTMYLNYGSGHGSQLQNVGSRPTDGAWHKYDLVFYYGTAKLELYQDGVLLKSDNYAPRTLDKTDSGATIAGISGDTGNTMMIRLRNKTSGNKKAYYDNIRIRRYDSTETFYPGFSDDFESSIATLTAAGSGSNRLACDSSSATFSGETGVYGKSATDTSIKITKNTNAASGSQGMYYANVGSTASYQGGGTVHIGFNMAFDNENKISTYMFNKFFDLQPSGGTKDTVFSLNPGVLKYGSNTIDVAWEGGKWYKFDVYITPGDGSSAKNKAAVYMNGKLMFDNYELSDYSFTQIADVRIGQREQVVSGYDDNVTYIDDFSYDYTPAGITPVYPTISLSSNSGSIKIVDTDTVFIDGSSTAGSVGSAVSVTGGTKYMISDTQTLASSSDNATDSYILVHATNDEMYIYPIVSGKIDRYAEDFSSHTYSAGDEIRYWSNITSSYGSDYRGTRTPVTGLAGKGAADQSLKNTQGRVAHNIQDLGLIADPSLKIVLEFNFLMNDTDAQELLEGFYDYEDGAGNVTSVTFAQFLKLQNGIVTTFGTNVGTYEENQWNKYVLEIDPTAFTADVYQNGTKIENGISIISGNMAGKTLTKIKRFKYQHTVTTDTTASKWSAIDDIKVYVGAYDPSADTQTLTAPSYIVNSSINWVGVPAATTESAFNSAVTLSNTSGQKTVFTDNKMATSTSTVAHNYYYAAETQGGAIHYYRIVDQTEKSIVISKTTTYGGSAISVGDTLSTGNYTMNAVYEKYNNDSESVYVILGTFDAGPPEELKKANFTQQALSFGTGETATVTTNLANSSYKLRAMIWDTDNYRALCTMTEY